MRTFSRFPPVPITELQRKAIRLAGQYDISCVLLNNQYTGHLYQKEEILVALGSSSELQQEAGNNFWTLQKYYDQEKDWLFGFMTYDLKNETENLSSSKGNEIDMPLMHFFSPEILIRANEKEILISGDQNEAAKVYEKLLKEPAMESKFVAESNILLQQRTAKEKYLQQVKSIQQHIQDGNVYELNYCIEYFVPHFKADAAELFIQLNEISPSPFAAFYKLYNRYLISASPERFIAKRNNKIISQPIKGTSRRGENPEEDELLKTELRKSEKDQAENVMIVDLVRNDLSRSSKAGSVKVEELFGIYSYPNVHQMISTVIGELRGDIHPVEAIRSSFPMGSMTGAPKVSAMKLIDELEDSSRGLYSGSVGYFSPDGDFDFNVVIRSMIYDQEKEFLSFHTGGAITCDSIPESEWEECLLKAGKMMQMLKG